MESAAKHSGKKRRSPIWARICTVFGIILAITAGSSGVGIYALSNHFDNQVKREDVFSQIPESERRTITSSGGKISGPLNILLIGVDNENNARASQNVFGERSDTIILFHIPASMDRAYAVSFPRDSYVNIPSQSGAWNGGENKINAAYSLGGAALLVRTVQKLSGLMVDYVATVSFTALHKMTDAVGGVDVYINKSVYDPRSKYTFKTGWNHIDSSNVEPYLRQRYNLTEGDFDRVKRQQQFLFALFKKALASGMLTDPVKFDRILSTAAQSLKVDKDFPLNQLAIQLHGIKPDKVKFSTLPFSRYLKTPYGSANEIDTQKSQALFSALKNGTMEQYLIDNPPNDVAKGR